MTISARPTMYSGIQMRSRLEAAFAEHLDRAGQTWNYEGNAYASSQGQYLPDFTIGDLTFHEVKPPNADFDEALQRMHVILASKPDARFMVWTRADIDRPFRVVRTCQPKYGCGRCLRARWDGILKTKSGALMDLREVLR